MYIYIYIYIILYYIYLCIHVMLRINCVHELIGEWREFYVASASASEMCRATSRGMRRLIRRRSIQAEADRLFDFSPLPFRFLSLISFDTSRTRNEERLDSTRIVNSVLSFYKIGCANNDIVFVLFFFPLPFACSCIFLSPV